MTNNKPLCIIRVDQDSEIGSGHLTRCEALAQELKSKGIKCHFIVHKIDKTKKRRLKSNRFPVHQINDVETPLTKVIQNRSIKPTPSSIHLVIDGYHFTSEYMGKLVESLPADSVAVAIDDFSDRSFYPVNVIVNQGPPNYRSKYGGKIRDDTTLLVGPKYSLIKKDFYAYRDNYEVNENVKNILITLGTAASIKDYETIMDYVLQASSAEQTITVVYGRPLNENNQINSTNDRIQLLGEVKSFPSLLSDQDIVISASGGSTLRELACLGIPTLTVQTSSNQRIGSWFDQQGFSKYLGSLETLRYNNFLEAFEEVIENVEIRKKMFKTGRNLVDKKGSSRVADSMLK